MNVYYLADYRPHMTINMGDSVHVVPVELIEHIAAGRHSADDVQSQLLAVALLDYIYGEDECD